TGQRKSGAVPAPGGAYAGCGDSSNGGPIMRHSLWFTRWSCSAGAGALLLTAAIVRAAATPSTAMSQGMSGGSCCPESGLLKGTMGTVAMGLGAVLLISLI